eukprot:gene8584-7642_t
MLVAAQAKQRAVVIRVGDDGRAATARFAFEEAPPLAGGALSAAGLLAVPVAGGVVVGDVERWEPR